MVQASQVILGLVGHRCLLTSPDVRLWHAASEQFQPWHVALQSRLGQFISSYLVTNLIFKNIPHSRQYNPNPHSKHLNNIHSRLKHKLVSLSLDSRPELLYTDWCFKFNGSGGTSSTSSTIIAAPPLCYTRTVIIGASIMQVGVIRAYYCLALGLLSFKKRKNMLFLNLNELKRFKW